MPTTITTYNTFAAGTKAKAGEVNANFDNHRGDLLPINEDSASASHQTHDLGSPTHEWANLYLTNQPSVNGVQNVDPNDLLNVPASRIISGAVGASATNDGFPIYLQKKSGEERVELNIPDSATSLLVSIDGTTYTITVDDGQIETAVLSDFTRTTPGTTDVLTVDETNGAGQTRLSDPEYRTVAGMYGGVLGVDNVGSDIPTESTLGFSVSLGAEYIIGYLENSSVMSIKRGYFLDSSNDAQVSLGFDDGQSWALMATYWIFIKSDKTLDTTPVNRAPFISNTEPGSPQSGDYWLDLGASQTGGQWKVYDGAAFTAAGAVLAGVAISDTAGVVGVRSQYYYKKYDTINDLRPRRRTTSLITNNQTQWSRVSVNGKEFQFGPSGITWTTGSLDTGSFANDTMYHLYVTEDGVGKISEEWPYDEWGERRGFYHPTHPWRCVGSLLTNPSSTDFYTVTAWENPESEVAAYGLGGVGSDGNHNGTFYFDAQFKDFRFCMAYDASTTRGDRVIIKRSGYYAINAQLRANTSANFKIGRNDSELDAGFTSFSGNTDILASSAQGANENASLNWSGWLEQGDIITCTSNDSAPGTSPSSQGVNWSVKWIGPRTS